MLALSISPACSLKKRRFLSSLWWLNLGKEEIWGLMGRDSEYLDFWNNYFEYLNWTFKSNNLYFEPYQLKIWQYILVLYIGWYFDDIIVLIYIAKSIDIGSKQYDHFFHNIVSKEEKNWYILCFQSIFRTLGSLSFDEV